MNFSFRKLFSKWSVVQHVVAIVVVVVVAVGGGVWFYHEKQMQALRNEALLVEFKGWRWMGASPLNKSFKRYVASTDRGVEFLGWKTIDPVGLKRALAAYNAQESTTQKVSYEHLVKTIGPDFRAVVAKTSDTWHDPAEYFFDWCYEEIDMINVRTGERVEHRFTLYDYWSHPEQISPDLVLRSTWEAQHPQQGK